MLVLPAKDTCLGGNEVVLLLLGYPGIAGCKQIGVGTKPERYTLILWICTTEVFIETEVLCSFQRLRFFSSVRCVLLNLLCQLLKDSVERVKHKEKSLLSFDAKHCWSKIQSLLSLTKLSWMLYNSWIRGYFEHKILLLLQSKLEEYIFDLGYPKWYD